MERWRRRAAALCTVMPNATATEAAVADGLFLAATYPEYPVVTHSTERWNVFGECTPRRTTLQPSTLAALERAQWSDDELRRFWLDHFSDADTLFVLAYDKIRRRLWFFNDGLSRLPVYWASGSGFFAMGRDYQTVLLAMPQIAIDEVQLAFTCLFRFPIDNRLPHRGVFRLPAATIGFFDFGSGSIRMSSDWQYLTPAYRNGGSFSERVDRFVELFLETIRQQSDGRSEVVLSLSSGLDSRAVGAALRKTAVPFSSATFELMDGTNSGDAAGAAKLAKLLECHHANVSIFEPDIAEYEDLFTLKSGLNDLEMGTLLPFLRAVRNRNASALLMTGAMGDPVMQNVFPRNLRSSDEIVNRTIFSQAIFPVEHVENWLRLKNGTIREYLHEMYRRYPTETAEKFREYLGRERLRAYIAEGEDRDRCYVATDTPFLARSVYADGTSVPPEWKVGDRYCRTFLSRLSPAIATVVNPSVRLAPDSPLYPVMVAVKPAAVRLRRKLFSFRLKGKMKPIHAQSPVLARMSALARTDAARATAPGLAAVIADPAFAHRPRPQQLTIYTVLGIVNGRV